MSWWGVSLRKDGVFVVFYSRRIKYVDPIVLNAFEALRSEYGERGELVACKPLTERKEGNGPRSSFRSLL